MEMHPGCIEESSFTCGRVLLAVFSLHSFSTVLVMSQIWIRREKFWLACPPPPVMVVSAAALRFLRFLLCQQLCQRLFPGPAARCCCVFVVILASFFRNHFEAPFPHPDICSPYRPPELEGQCLAAIVFVEAERLGSAGAGASSLTQLPGD